jgi:hypothetical protein
VIGAGVWERTKRLLLFVRDDKLQFVVANAGAPSKRVVLEEL